MMDDWCIHTLLTVSFIFYLQVFTSFRPYYSCCIVLIRPELVTSQRVLKLCLAVSMAAK